MLTTDVVRMILGTFERKLSFVIELSQSSTQLKSYSAGESYLVVPKASLSFFITYYLQTFIGKKAQHFPYDSDSFFEREAKAKGAIGNKNISLFYIHNSKSYIQTYRDLVNSLEWLPTGSYIVVEGCNPKVPEQAYPAGSEEQLKQLVKEGLLKKYPDDWIGDVWKAIVRLRYERKDLDIFVLDADLGIAVIRKVEPRTGTIKGNMTTQQITNLTYRDLEKNREEFLNLKDSSFIYEYLKR